MSFQRFLAAAALAAIASWSAPAWAAPLTLVELDQLDVYLQCRQDCADGRIAEQASCNATCGASQASWDKDINSTVNWRDSRLAWLEYWDATGRQICYQGQAVVPLGACSLSACTAALSAAACADADGDGLRQYIEQRLGTSDSGGAASAQRTCTSGLACNGFQERCRTVDETAGGSWCIPRQGDLTDNCPGGVCTAFHFETIANDDNQVIVRVFYDYSPVPATVLDLRLTYNPAQLQLADARPMPAIANRGKELAIRHETSTTLRLIVLSPESSAPIANGAIAELVFRRLSASSSTVAFSTNSFARSMSMAPSQGAFSSALSSNGLWGASVSTGAATGNKLSLYYSFDNAGAPLDTTGNMSAATLCAAAGDTCSTPSTMRRYEALQRGVIEMASNVPGPSGPGIYLDGYADHVELPIYLRDNLSGSGFIPNANQNYTLTFWMYNDDDPSRQVSSPHKLLFSRNGTSETTSYGLVATPLANGTHFDLNFFTGDITVVSPALTAVASGALGSLPSRTWTHVAMTFNASTRRAEFYVDGVKMCTNSGGGTRRCTSTSDTPVQPLVSTAAATGYPFLSQASRDVDVKIEGTGPVGSRDTDQIFFASSENNLYGIERMETNGLDRREIFRTGSSSARDVDYSPIVDKIVYASSESGSYEIWLANGDGSERQKITSSFGATDRGIFALRPRWAPDASAIVFESNVYDPEGGDNRGVRGYNLYYIQYDPSASNGGRLDIGGTGNGPSELDYDALLTAGQQGDYRLTQHNTGNYSNAIWLRSRQPGINRGELVAGYTDRDKRNSAIKRIVVQENILTTSQTGVSDFRATIDGVEMTLLAAHPNATASGRRYFYKQESEAVGPHPQFTFSATRAVTGQPSQFEIDVIHTPSGYASNCWDMDRDGLRDQGAAGSYTEDINGNGTVDVADCYPIDVGNLYIEYPAAVGQLSPVRNVDQTVYGVTTLSGKTLKLSESFDPDTYVTVGIASPTSSATIAAGAVVARLRFTGSTSLATSIRAMRRTGTAQYLVQTGSNTPVTLTVAPTDLAHIFEADFSPAGDRFLLSGVQASRPVLITATAPATGATGTVALSGIQKISIDPERLSGVQWTRVERLYPAAWIGAYRDDQSHLYKAAFRGGLDEIKVYSYLRDPKTFDSEAALGGERLEKAELDGVLANATTPCETSTDCPAYQLCNTTTDRCYVDDCSTDPVCPEGKCTTLPVPAGNDGTTFARVCSVECSSEGADTECFQQECLNGPCRFCSAEEACIECKPKQPHDIGGITLFYADGCPDRNSFWCEAGNCLTECYAFQNDQSEYLCDPATEYCREGRCVAFEWQWNDLSPFSFSGAGQMLFNPLDRSETQAVSQLYRVEIQAYGAEDYLHPPEVLVQGKVTGRFSPHGTNWFDLGRLTIYNRTQAEATQPNTRTRTNRYVLETPEPITQLRFQLVENGWLNPENTASGTMTRNRHFCGAGALPAVIRPATGCPATRPYPAGTNNLCELSTSIPAGWSPTNGELCFRRPSGSRAMKGFTVGVLEMQAREDCFANAQTLGIPASCPPVETVTQNPLQRYLGIGQPAVIIHRVDVEGALVLDAARITKNTICSYEGTTDPGTTNPRRIWFGNIASESSAQREVVFPAAGPSNLLEFESVSNGSYGLLNCNYANPGAETSAGMTGADIAELVLDFTTDALAPTFYPTSSASSPNENGNSCTWDINGQFQQCFEWMSGPSIDPFNQPTELYRTLDFDTYRASGFH